MKSFPRLAATTLAVLTLTVAGTVNAAPALAQGSCPYYNYCIWIDSNFRWPYCYWENNDGNYWNDWCGSGGGNEHLAANAASSYHNNGAPAEFDSVRSFKQAWGAGNSTWVALRGYRVAWVGVTENDDAESHYWYNG